MKELAYNLQSYGLDDWIGPEMTGSFDANEHLIGKEFGRTVTKLIAVAKAAKEVLQENFGENLPELKHGECWHGLGKALEDLEGHE